MIARYCTYPCTNDELQEHAQEGVKFKFSRPTNLLCSSYLHPRYSSVKLIAQWYDILVDANVLCP